MVYYYGMSLMTFLIASGGRIVRAEVLAVTFRDGKVMEINCTCTGNIIEVNEPDAADDSGSDLEEALADEIPTEDLAREVSEAVSECLVNSTDSGMAHSVNPA